MFQTPPTFVKGRENQGRPDINVDRACRFLHPNVNVAVQKRKIIRRSRIRCHGLRYAGRGSAIAVPGQVQVTLTRTDLKQRAVAWVLTHERGWGRLSSWDKTHATAHYTIAQYEALQMIMKSVPNAPWLGRQSGERLFVAATEPSGRHDELLRILRRSKRPHQPAGMPVSEIRPFNPFCFIEIYLAIAELSHFGDPFPISAI